MKHHQITTTPPKLCQFKCLDVIDSPSSPLLDESNNTNAATTSSSILADQQQENGTLIAQVELIVANTGERLLDLNNNVPPTLTRFVSYENTLQLQFT